MNILNIPSYYNFLKGLHEFILSKSSNELALSNLTILLPSRRSCNELKRIFLENSKREAIILPNIRAIGDIDYDDLILRQVNKNDIEFFSEFSSNASRIKYKILLLKELIKWSKKTGKDLYKNMSIEQASDLALELEKFLNEVNKNGLSLDGLNNIVDEEYSKHWQEILDFLGIFGKEWNKFIEDNNIISSVDFKTKTIEFTAEYFKTNKPANPIIIAGVSGSVRSTCKLIKNILQYDNCYYIFKGFDTNLTEEEWKNVNVFHPQYSFKNLLVNCLESDMGLVKNLNFPDSVVGKNIEKILTYSMLPNTETYKWHDKLKIKEEDFKNISKIECVDNFEELNVISFITKHAHETTEDNIAIIVSDDNFAYQLEVMLTSMNLRVNNVFGNKISKTEFVKYLFLILDVIKSNFETIAFLSLLKHDFTLFSYDKNELNNLTLLLEDNVLRGAGNLGLKGIIKKTNDFGDKALIEFINKVSDLLLGFKIENLNLDEILRSHIELSERISLDEKFWNDEKNGNELLSFFNEMLIESVDYGVIKDCDEYSHILDYLIAENSYSDRYSIHPVINIISPQEARLINYDLIVIANLNDGKFPPHIPTDPWLSKSMRNSFGLSSKDELIGNYAYDWTQYLCNKKVILTRALKDGGVPTIKSKYLMRLETFLLCQGNLKIREDNTWKNLYKKYNSLEANKTISRPKPTPPLEKRPKELYATKIEKLMNNPYDIYAEKILNLKKKEDFYENKDFAFFGSAVHEALEVYVKNYNDIDKNYLFETLIKYGRDSFDKYFTSATTRELFFIRFSNIAKWFVDKDEEIRAKGYKVYAERIEKVYMKDLDFTLSAKIDRIEEGVSGKINIIDYKTGTAPGNSDVVKAKKPQLVIEAVIMDSKNKKTESLAYWSIKGKNDEKIMEVKADVDELILRGEYGVRRLVSYFKVYENSYIATAYDLNEANHKPSDYKHLSRVEEWGYL